MWGYLPDDTLSYCNQRWIDYTGLTRVEARHEGWTARIHPADVERALMAWREARTRHKPYEADVRLRAADGCYRRFVSRAVPLCDGHGEFVQWFGTNTDVEERRQLHEALDRAETEIAHVARLTTLGELASSLAHELNQPLAAVVANGDACMRWLNRGEPNLAEATGAVQRMIRDANRASDVIAHTRALLRKSTSEKTPLDIAAVIREILALVHQEVLKHRIISVSPSWQICPRSRAIGSSSSR